MSTLRSHLAYKPQPLKFGTNGRRGEVVHLTQLEVYTNVVAEMHYLHSLPQSEGGIRAGDDFSFAHDLCPSSTKYVENGRGALGQTVEKALKDTGMHPINLGDPHACADVLGYQARQGQHHGHRQPHSI